MEMEKEFLQQMISEERCLTVFLVSGFQMHGVITGMDENAIQLNCDGRKKMVYKHAISTIDPYSY